MNRNKLIRWFIHMWMIAKYGLKVIPKGYYCYSHNIPCSYYEFNENKSNQECGFCWYLNEGDWEDKKATLLWDMVKECNINKELDE